MERHALVRVFAIDRLIRADRYPNVRDLARRFEVSRRTIERDLETMRDSFGAPLRFSRQHGGYCYEHTRFMLPRVELTEGELISIMLGQKLVGAYAGTPFGLQIKMAFEKLCVLLPNEITVDLTALESAVSFDPEPSRGEPEHVLQTYRAILRMIQLRRAVHIRYYSLSSDKHTERRVDPYHLICHGGAWYVIGFCHERREVRTFAVDRIDALTETDYQFEPAPDFSISAFLAHSFGIEAGAAVENVVIRFDYNQGRYIRERQWHETQTIEELPDGSIILRMRVTGLSEVKRWVLGYGAHAEVVAPEKLRRDVESEIREMAQKYGYQIIDGPGRPPGR